MKWMTYYLTLIFLLLSFFPITCSQTNNFFTLKTYRAGPCCCDSLTESSKIHVHVMYICVCSKSALVQIGK